MLGMPIDSPFNYLCDNYTIYRNALFTNSQLKKKHQLICFNRARECVASNVFIPHRVNTFYNLADLPT